MTRSIRLLSVWSSRGSVLDLDDEGPLAGRLGPVDQLDAPGLAVGGCVDLLGLEVPFRLGIGRAGVAFLEPDDELLTPRSPGPRASPGIGRRRRRTRRRPRAARSARGRRAGSGLPRPIGIEGHALAGRQLGGLGERLALGGLAVGEQHDRRGRGPAELGEDLADPVAEPRLGARPPRASRPWRRPARGRRPGPPRSAAARSWRRGRSGRGTFPGARGAAGRGPGGSGPWRSPAGSRRRRPIRRGRRTGDGLFAGPADPACTAGRGHRRIGQPGGRWRLLGLLILVGDRLARRVVHHDREVRQARPLDARERPPRA